MKTYNKRLYRSEDNKIVLGIMGGFGEYFDVDPTILRALYIICSVFTAVFPGIIAYFLMGLIVPKHPEVIKAEMKQAEDNKKEASHESEKHHHKEEDHNSQNKV